MACRCQLSNDFCGPEMRRGTEPAQDVLLSPSSRRTRPIRGRPKPAFSGTEGGIAPNAAILRRTTRTAWRKELLPSRLLSEVLTLGSVFKFARPNDILWLYGIG